LDDLNPTATDLWRQKRNTVAHYFRKLGQNQLALQEYEKALEVDKNHFFDGLRARVLLESRILTVQLAIQDHFLPEGNALFLEGKYEAALEKYRASLAFADEMKVPGAMAYRHCCIARTLYPLEGAQSALEECQKAKNLLQSLEVQNSQESIEETQLLHQGLLWLNKKEVTDSTETSGDSLVSNDDANLLGVSVEYLKTTFLAEVVVAGYSETSTINDIEDLIQKEILGVIRRKGARHTSPVEGLPGSSYIHCLRGKDVGRAQFMLSYSWRYDYAITSCWINA
jgi:tetratricopeptide (TPR) repeat protein